MLQLKRRNKDDVIFFSFWTSDVVHCQSFIELLNVFNNQNTPYANGMQYSCDGEYCEMAGG